jgi:hypothetical protein
VKNANNLNGLNTGPKSVDDLYLYGLNPEKLEHNDYWLVVITVAFSYCELHSVQYIRYSRLRAISDHVVNQINKQRSGLGGGSFASIIKTCCRKGFLRIHKVSEKETRVYPNIPLIKKEVEADNKIIRIVSKFDPMPRHRGIREGIPGKVSDTVNAVVTRANPKKSTRRPKHVSTV